jgi:hypothetical protein
MKFIMLGCEDGIFVEIHNIGANIVPTPTIEACPCGVGLHGRDVNAPTERAHINAQAKIRVTTAHLKVESFEFHEWDVLDDKAKFTWCSDILVSDRKVLAIKSSTELLCVWGRRAQPHTNFIKLGRESGLDTMCSQVQVVYMTSVTQKLAQCDVIRAPFPRRADQAVSTENAEASHISLLARDPREGIPTRAVSEEFVDEEDMVEIVWP